jgi:hypothetical protein
LQEGRGDQRRRIMRMKRFAAIASAIGAIGAVAAPAATADPQHDSVTGAGTTFFGEQFSITAMSGPLGENPSGQVRVGTFSGDVTCVRVHSDFFPGLAVIGVDLPLGGATRIQVVDGGPQGPDQLDRGNTAESGPEICDLFGDPAVIPPIDKGQITVRDALP